MMTNRATSPPTGGARDRFEDYVSVAERVEKFYQQYPTGAIRTTIIEHDRESGFVLMRADVFRAPDDALPAATGHAYEYRDAGFVQKTSYVEVCETSAAGRALALLGFEVKRGIASRDEMQAAHTSAERSAPPAQRATGQAPATGPRGVLTPDQMHAQLDTEIIDLTTRLGYAQDKLQQWFAKKWESSSKWQDMSIAIKGEIKKELQTKLDERKPSERGGAKK